MFIKPATDVLSIGQIDTVWVIAEVFEQQSGWVKKGQTVDMAVGALNGNSWQGEVDYIYPVLDAKTRTLRVRIRFDNPGELLKPNMFARLQIRAIQETESLYIPREALIRSGRLDRVVKSFGDGSYQSVPVKAGIEVDNSVEILEGLKEGQMIVTSAQFLIDSESSLTASFARLQDSPDISNMANMGDTMMEEPANEEPDQVWVDGSINSISRQDSKLNLNHDPVESWGWPSMMMDFTVAKSVDINQLKQGQSMQFLVRKLETGGIEIIDVKQEQ
jgi:Cu(I)/Ag(I) efflux system membrane fusion protein